VGESGFDIDKCLLKKLGMSRRLWSANEESKLIFRFMNERKLPNWLKSDINLNAALSVQPSLCKAIMKIKLKLYAIAATSTRCIITDSVLQWRMQPKSIARDDSLEPVVRGGHPTEAVKPKMHRPTRAS
jgi:hypothetical protein